MSIPVLIMTAWASVDSVVERAVVLLTREYVSERELPLVEVEKEVILAALEKTGGNKTEAARQLGIMCKTLLAKLSR